MKILIAPDSFKECITAREFCDIAKKSWLAVRPQDEIISLPMADGGEGLAEILVDHHQGRQIEVETVDPLGRPIVAKIGLLNEGKTAVIDTAGASGLHLLSDEEKDPSIASTFGTGILVKKALDLKVEKIIIGLGGSATNDAGAGFLAALGAKLIDKKGTPLKPGGLALIDLEQLALNQLDPRVFQVQWQCACDVDNPLLGVHGASHVYGPQKGADQQLVEKLDFALSNFSKKLQGELGEDFSNTPGSGAAGGLGLAIIAVLKAECQRGIDLVLDTHRFDEHLKLADLVITGEGKLDLQTLAGKVPIGVAKRAQKAGVPVIAIAGEISEIANFEKQGINAVFSISCKPQTLREAINNTPSQLASLITNLAKIPQLF